MNLAFANQPPCLCSWPPSSLPKSYNRHRNDDEWKRSRASGAPCTIAAKSPMVLGLWRLESSCLPACLHPLHLLFVAGTHHLLVFRGFRIVMRFADWALGPRISTGPTATNLFCFLHQENSISLFPTMWQTQLSKPFGPNIPLVWPQPIFGEISPFSEDVAELTRPPKPKVWDWFSADCPVLPTITPLMMTN